MTIKRVVVFISGTGSNMIALAQAAASPSYPAEIVAVISDNASSKGLAKAATFGIPTHIIARNDFYSKVQHEEAMLALLSSYHTDIICFAGFMRLVSPSFIAPYHGRILNIHPSLLPLFSGLNTHQRAIDAGMKIAGCSVHLVTEKVDDGPIIAQGAVPILAGDTADSLSTRVLQVEHRLYPAALKKFICKEPVALDPNGSLLSM